MDGSNLIPPRSVTRFAESDRYRAEIHGLVVGGAHTYSKGDDQFPALSPAAIARGQGGRVWDLDGNAYVDCGLGLGAVSLGHAFRPVLDAVHAAIEHGAAFQRPAAVERELARELLAMMPGMERVKFAKNGSNVTTAAVKLARAFTGRDLVAFPGNHPFYSFDDWFIGATKVANGVPDEFRALSRTYRSTDPESLAAVFRDNPGRIACVITEPEDFIPNPPEVIREVERITKANGAVFILDEMVSGFRAGLPGSYAGLGLSPDLATWGKAIGNGFSFCALTGRADIMDLGGIRENEHPRVFLLSSTHGGEAHTLAAARAVLATYREQDVLGHHRRLTARVTEGWRQVVKDRRLEGAITVHASPWRVILACADREGVASSALRTLLLQEMIGRGVLCQGYFVPCFAHTDDEIDTVISAFDAAAAVYALALDHGTEDFLVGEAARPVFRKWNGCRQVCPASPCPHEVGCRQHP
jgi:glutamate-1-semialdehyde aminotransferase